MALVDEKDYAELIGISPGTGTGAAQIRATIEAAIAEMVAYCDQPLVAVAGNVVFTFADHYLDRKLVTYRPIVGITSLSYTTGVINGADIVIDPSLYQLRHGFLYLMGGFEERCEYTLTMTVGYDPAAIPADLRAIAVDLAKYMLLQHAGGEGDNRFGLATRATGESGVGITASSSFLNMRADLMTRLDNYRRRTF